MGLECGRGVEKYLMVSLLTSEYVWYTRNMNRSLLRSLFCLATVFMGSLLWMHSVAAATCALSTNTTIDAAYVETNSCDAITLTGTPTITWSGTIDTGRAVAVSVNSGTVVFSGALVLGDAGSSVTVASGATVTHAASDATGVRITAPTVTIIGTIDTNAKGCVANSSGTAFGPDVTTGTCTSGTSGYGMNDRGGAGHGGAGGGSVYGIPGGTTYGSSTNPILLGSGGGGVGSSQLGGAGGGLVRLVVSGTLTISGTIAANGGAGVASYGGGGSGGSVYVNASTLAGAGTITANGGVAGNEAGGGGGGRIAVFYNTLTTFNLSSITATGGIRTGATGGAGSGQNGSTFMLDRTTDDGAGSLFITSGLDFVSGGDYSRTSIVAASGAQFTCNAPGSLTIQAATVNLNGATISCASTLTSLVVSSTGVLWLSGSNLSFTGSVTNALFVGAQGINSTSSVITLSNTQQATFAATSSWQNTSSTVSVTKIGSQTEFQIPQTTTFTRFYFYGAASALNGTTGLVLPASLSLSLVSSTLATNIVSTFTDLSIDSNSSISADGRGCAPANLGVLASGPNASTGVCTVSTTGYGPNDRGGAGHGGAGGGSIYGVSGGVTYGSSTSPSLLGSGGGTATGQSAGGTGGGLIRLTVTGTLTLNGSVKAIGGNALNATYGGGGSGGSIYIYTGVLAGTGTIIANGGVGGVEAGGGGGGRIAVLYSQLSGFSFSTTNVTSTGGLRSGSASAGSGSVGTIYTFQTNSSPDLPVSLGQASLVDGSTTSTDTPTFRFTLSDPDISDTSRFRIQIDDSADFASPVVDYTSALAAQGVRTFQVGQAAGSGSYTVGSASQTLTSGSYYWRVKAIDASAVESSYTIANGGSVAFIVDTAVRTVQFEQTSASDLESVTATSVKILLNTTHFETVTVNYDITGGSASSGGVDYTLATGTATIIAGQTSTTLPLTIINDAIDEGDETVVLTLSAPVFASLGASTTFAYTIVDDDVAGVTLSTSTVNVAEGGATDSYTLVLTSQPTSTVQILFSTSTYGVTLSTSTIDFTTDTWNVPQSITVTATNDAVNEGPHTSLITHSMAVPTGFAYGYSVTPPSITSVTATIGDNDSPGVWFAGTSTLAVTEGSVTDDFTVRLTSQPTSTVSVSFVTTTNGVALSTSTIAFTSANWDVPIDVTVTAIDDVIAEGTASASVTTVISSTAYGYSGLSVPVINVTVTDNDSAGVSISKSSFAVVEAGATDSYTIVLTRAPTTTVEILLTSNNARLSLSSSIVTFTSSTWNVPQVVTISVVNDTLFQPTQSGVISHAASSTGIGYLSDLVISSLEGSLQDTDNPGGGAASGGGSGGGSVQPIANIVSNPTPPPVSAPAPLPPVIVVAPPVDTPSTEPIPLPIVQPGQEVVQILNPTNILSLVEATNGTRDFASEAKNGRLVLQDAKQFKVSITDEQELILANFVTYGISERTRTLGSGERRALVRDAMETMKTANISPTDLELLARGFKAKYRNKAAEIAQLPRVRQTFLTMYGHLPDFKVYEQDLAWNTLMYRIRFPRDLKAEQRGIVTFKKLFNKAPTEPFQWAVVRVLGYVKTEQSL